MGIAVASRFDPPENRRAPDQIRYVTLSYVTRPVNDGRAPGVRKVNRAWYSRDLVTPRER
jgi:hypothetical protein